MSDSKKQLNEFEQLLESVSPADPQGSPMQIMYLAGQQSKASPSSDSAVRIWKTATLFSSAAAACLCLILAIPDSTELKSTPMASVSQSPPSSPVRILSNPKTSTPRSQRPSGIEIAQSQLPKSSIEMFGDFELEPIDPDRFVKERFQ